MSFKVQLSILITMSVIALSIQKSVSASSSKKACSLEDMRHHAANACDHLFTREKRQLSNDLLDSWDTPPKKAVSKIQHPHKGVKIRRKDFPDGGYLIVDHKNARILSQRNIKPKYHIIDWHSKKLYDNRVKRASIATVNVTYCCMHYCSSLEVCLASSK